MFEQTTIQASTVSQRRINRILCPFTFTTFYKITVYQQLIYSQELEILWEKFKENKQRKFEDEMLQIKITRLL